MNLSEEEIYSLCKLGHQLYSREHYEDARKLFEGLVSIDDSRGYPWHILGLIARERGNWQRAVDCFQNRLHVEPDAAESRVALAETLYEAGRVPDACDVLEHFRRNADDDSRAARRGRVLLRRWR